MSGGKLGSRSPAIGFLHSGKPLSFVYDIADLFKFETVIPVAMQVAGRAAKDKLSEDPIGEVRRACRDVFRRTMMLQNIIPTIEDVLMAGDVPLPSLERVNN
jgi:CRISP-associated protein Cas1